VQRPSVRADAWRLRTAEAARIFPDDGPFEPLFVATTVSLAPPAEVDVQVEIVPGELRATVIDVATGKLVKGRRLTFAGKKADGTTIRLGAPREATDGTLVIPFAETVKGEVSAQVSDVATGIGTSAEAVLK
jgi:hypothetical protein